jgi:Uma2 family endonuclease
MSPRVTSPGEFWAIPEHERFHELIAGELIRKAAPSGEHGHAQAGLVAALRPPFHREAGGSSAPGGWWLATEVEVQLSSGDLVRPDVLAWRREHCPSRPTGTPVKTRPDWICEIVSASNSSHDTLKKLRLYHRVEVPCYWLVDPRDATLTVMRWHPDGYVTLARCERGARVRAEPFDAVELTVGTLFGDDPPELP